VTDQPLVSVIIPNWNGIDYLPTCLNALRAQTHSRVEVIIADNASTDGSLALICDEYPEVKLVALGTNRGFTGACNAGIDAAQGEIIALLNNDTEAAPTWLEAVVGAFARYPEAGIVASKMLLFDRRDTLHAAGDFVRKNGLPGNRGVWEKDDGASAYRRVMLDSIGLLDDDFFFSCEDVDLAWRAQLSGWRAVYVPDAVVYHHLAATGGGVTASYYDGRNTLWLIAKNMPGALLRRYGFTILRGQWQRAWQALRAWRGTAARATLRGMAAGLVGLPRMLGKRRQVQSLRTEEVATIDTLLTPIGKD
jgi:GT2 family glycosyltransferase